ncbi:MAG: Hpt domain-containing protein [Pegethrix bostrychoides GSE-TBD4-15B]|jgi:HPt (histidine-containing phosphotransfer) domain-containing protein|uniref:Hpt domain-containing protein n=1 Tax=Pegethrix bostrychoides GSE-TBD4-15B TaxID=2839662 RepID=A0A951PDC0_9CYAN|nr:Hpt domain-containing protein [Pegethrix bostrychoides GSE-TBD4-15B]
MRATSFHTTLCDLQFDLAQLQQLSDHDLAFEQELLQLYLDDFQAQLKRLQSAIRATAWLQIQQIAHHIKGASASVGAILPAQLATAIEQQAQQVQRQLSGDNIGDIGEISALYQQLVAQFEQMQQQICPMLKPSD